MSGSEIARLRRQLEAEYLAGRWALYGLACGWAKHEYIQRRLRNMEEYQSKLAQLVGPERAAAIVCEVIDDVRDKDREQQAPGQTASEEATPEGEGKVGIEEKARLNGNGLNGSGAGAGQPLAEEKAALDEGEREPIIKKTLWLLAYRHSEEEADMIYLFYAVSDEEARIIADLKMEQGGRHCCLLMLRKLPAGFGVPYGRYRGCIHVRPDGSIIEGDYLKMRTTAQD
ncbi:MAG: hypothetical protein IRZ31_19870 [Thermogemmatispora sp.]|uniref:hypothetical protein n=1 Tax=Thermogemmatispora sp. TaxID=1968838 RepID=UPI00262D9216|nr:hypothetical protein [Thermogemmatispora sp.]MBX5459156.1 hypothetical protein [Thermogemmatispora sp.]